MQEGTTVKRRRKTNVRRQFINELKHAMKRHDIRGKPGFLTEVMNAYDRGMGELATQVFSTIIRFD